MPDKVLPNSFNLAWDSLEGMLKGISAIDMAGMYIHSLEEAEQFIASYGFDYAEDRDELAMLRDEAVSFITRRLLDPEMDTAEDELGLMSLEPPTHFMETDDIRILLLTASQGRGLEQHWACAILKVMHILCHINHTVLYRYFGQARQQIVSRYDKAIAYAPSGELILDDGEGFSLPLVGMEIKDEKSRDSMLLKLLAKRENVAEEIFDMIGIRLITRTPAEAVLALEILRRRKIVMFSNIIPSRSRNSLIDFDTFKREFGVTVKAYRKGDLQVPEIWQALCAISSPPVSSEAFNPLNLSSLSDYRAIHLTERQLVRFRHPVSDEEVRFFFPYEIQLMDEAAYLQNMSGSSAHALYKQNQVCQARRRVLGPLLAAAKRQNRRRQKQLQPEPTA